ncbi:hypothetical protein A1O3_03351 [Capronia epimyces CBS 606.96]|uniref:F-box domain-containing protein n=1 Tax=Capronia epimyces CBS 606.96 TaxID=1182542 RepID=W9Y9U9_9EURO|nr:uncharacterized protein A1O3_03351 [Capronia epimyces CBS 606.96]EXJ86400.1 hypothetical protein A1O3_03351 [Capronia epimyces CBS 606.96]
MKVGDPVYRGDPVPLPVEVVWVIASYFSSDSEAISWSAPRPGLSGLLFQATLWACCLVSRTWYTASIEHLYNRPVLTTRNFDLFVRTIAPSISSTPTSSRRTWRRTPLGLEDLIKHLDMSELSYESSKSITARLVSRTKNSLESFVPPAITFSIPSLASLSKCRHLRSLDLSTDHYDIGLPRLLHAMENLDQLIFLKLPRNGLWMQVKPESRWPKNLQCLQLSHRLCETEDRWATLFNTWPDTLTSLKVVQCYLYWSFQCLWKCPSPARSIRHLSIGPSIRGGGLPLGAIVHAFPALTTLELPVHIGTHMTAMYEEDPSGVGYIRFSMPPMSPQHPLETITLTDHGHPTEPKLDDMIEIFDVYVDRFPRLRRINLAQNHFNVVAGNESFFKVLSKALEDRADPADKYRAGVFPH